MQHFLIKKCNQLKKLVRGPKSGSFDHKVRICNAIDNGFLNKGASIEEKLKIFKSFWSRSSWHLLVQINDGNTRTICEIKTSGRPYSGDSIVTYE